VSIFLFFFFFPLTEPETFFFGRHSGDPTRIPPTGQACPAHRGCDAPDGPDGRGPLRRLGRLPCRTIRGRVAEGCGHWVRAVYVVVLWLLLTILYPNRKFDNVRTTHLIDKTFSKYVFVMAYGSDVEWVMLVVLPN